MNYAFPGAIVLTLFIIIFAGLFWILFSYRKSLATLPGMPRSTPLFWMKVALLCIAWFFATIALMQPFGLGEEIEEAKQKKHEVLFLLDASASMSVKDAQNGNTRLEYAKEIADEIAGALDGEQVALYAFTSEPTKLVPLTLSTPFLRLMLSQIRINEGDKGGTDINRALENIDSSPGQIVILLTDGGEEPIKPASQTVFTIGIGSRGGGLIPDLLDQGKPIASRLNESALKNISASYFFANETNAYTLAKEVRKFLDQREAPTISSPTQIKSPKLYFQFPLAIALICLALYILLPNTRKSFALVLIIPIADYNLATELLNQGKEKHAVIIFETIQTDNPKLQEAIDTNVSIAKFRAAKTIDELHASLSETTKAHVKLAINEKMAEEEFPTLSRIDAIDHALFLLTFIETIPADSPLKDKYEKWAKAQGITESIEELKNEKKRLENTFIPTEKRLRYQLLKNALTNGKNRDAIKEAWFKTQPKTAQNALKEAIDLNKSQTDFLAIVRQEQLKNYAKGLCQQHPWETVLPLFFQGKEQLKKRNRFWYEALLELENPTIPEEKTKTLEKTLSTLQEMEAQDREQKPIKAPQEALW